SNTACAGKLSGTLIGIYFYSFHVAGHTITDWYGFENSKSSLHPSDDTSMPVQSFVFPGAMPDVIRETVPLTTEARAL
ncbi:MAG: hypothetical protein VX900_14815, partial [Pseudomonadota bacterium]|nr:hypothetical protein [Pseudomonadota bacterium]